MAGLRSVQLDVILCVFFFTRGQKYWVLHTRLRDGCSSFRAKKSSFLGLGCAPSGWQKNRHLLILSLPRVLKEEFLPGIVFEIIIIIIHLLSTFVTRILALVHSRKNLLNLIEIITWVAKENFCPSATRKYNVPSPIVSYTMILNLWKVLVNTCNAIKTSNSSLVKVFNG